MEFPPNKYNMCCLFVLGCVWAGDCRLLGQIRTILTEVDMVSLKKSTVL